MLEMGVLWAVLGALGWSVSDALRKVMVADVPALSLAIQLLVVQAFCLLPFIALDNGQWPQLFEHADQTFLGIVFLSALLAAVGYVAFLEALKRGELSRSIPYLALSPAFSVIGGLLLLDEQPRIWLLVGLAAVVIGAFGLYPNRQTLDAKRQKYTRHAIMLMAGVALVWSLSGVLDKLGLTYVSGQIYFILHSVLTLLLLTAYAALTLTQIERPADWKAVRGLVLVGAVMLAAMQAQYAAYETLQVAIVEAIKRVGGLVGGLIFGYALFGERVGVRELLCIGAMASGVWFILA